MSTVKFNEKYTEHRESTAGDVEDPNAWNPGRRNTSIYNRRVSKRGSVVNSSATPPPRGTLVNSDRAYSQISEKLEDFADLHDEAREHAEKQTTMGFWEGLRTYPTAAAWSVLLSSSIIMEGYDTNLLGSFFAFPQFNEKFGDRLPDGQYQVPSGWQTGLMNSAQVGSLIGLIINGFMCDKIGYKKTYLIAMAMMTGFIFLTFFADSRGMLLAGQGLSGIPWGMFQTLSVAYASEICPTCLRGYLTTYANICWVIGQVLSSGVLRGFLSTSGQWSYRIPFAIQWVFIPPIAMGALFAPESPWWLVRHERWDAAGVSVKRLMSNKERADPNNVTNTLSQMKLTNEHEQALSAGTSYLDLFKGIDLRRTEVACFTWATQNLTGSALMGYSTYFYKNAGLPTSQAYNLSLAQYALGFFGTIGSWVLMSYAGRRTLYLMGLVLQFLLLCVIGGLGFIPANETITESKRSLLLPRQGAEIRVNRGAGWAVGSLLLVFTLVFDLSVGPVCYAIVAECSSTRLRQKTVVIARFVYNVCGIIINVITPLMLNPGNWNWGAKTGLLWAGISLLCIAWCFFRLPETKNRTFQELTILFENRISARKFATTNVDSFRSTSIAVQQGAAYEAEAAMAAKGVH